MYSRLLQPPKGKSFFLFGPRGTGKTTWVKTAFPKALYLDLLEAELFTDLLANPSRLERLIPAGFRDWIILDEIQRVPELLNEVHRLIESAGHRFVLTGSSPRKLRRKGYNLLAGRALTYAFHPLTAVEQGKDFDLARALRFGHLPSVFTEADPRRYLESYVQTYLEQEVSQEGLTRNLSGFSRFLEAASFSQGSVLNISSVSRECSVGRKVVEHHFEILEDLLIGYRIPVFTKRAKRRVTAHPKFYFFDAGVFRAIRPRGPLDVSEEIDGLALETLIFQELLALNDILNTGYTISYWRTADGAEVDFVLYGERGMLAFEVKRATKISRNVLHPLHAFIKDYPATRAYMFYGGRRREQEGTITILPIVDALQQLPDILLWK